MLDREIIILVDGQRIVDLSLSYSPNTNEIVVSLNGQVINNTVEYIELGPNQLALSDPAVDGESLEIRKI